MCRVVEGRWYNIQLRQRKVNERYTFKVFFDGEELLTKENEAPKEFRNCVVDVGTVDNPPVHGYYRNFHVACEYNFYIRGPYWYTPLF